MSRKPIGVGTSTNGRRGQTTIDFVVAIGLFLLAVAFVFTVVPGVLAPFSTASDQSVSANRVASNLGSDQLGNPGNPYVLNETCVVKFYNGSPPGNCRYQQQTGSQLNLSKVTGVSRWTSVNTTIENESGVVTLSGTNLAAGPPVSLSRESISVGTRVVYINGSSYTMYVRLW